MEKRFGGFEILKMGEEHMVEHSKISIVMPCLNSAAYIGMAIESVLKQTLTELELIIVDAGSTDSTLKIIEKYKKEDDRIVVLVSEKKSLGHQYNKGIQYARGKYIGFIESDDFIHCQMYQKLYEKAEENQLDFVKSDFDLFMGDGDKRLILNYSILTAYYKDLYYTVIEPQKHSWILYHDMNMWNGLYNRMFLLENHIMLNETKGAAFQDMGFVFQTFISAKRVMYIQSPSYYYRRDNENASQYNRMSHMQFVTDELEFTWEYMNQRQISIPFREIIFNRCFGLFSQIYGHYLCHDSSEKKKIDCREYLKVLRTCYEAMDYSEIRDEELDESISFNMLRLGEKQFDTAVKCNYQSKQYMEKAFFDFIDNHKFIIFGLGEQGKALLALCHKRNIRKNVVGLCDNDKKKSGENFLGKICKLPNEFYEENPELWKEVYFVIANVTCYEEIRDQMINMGIERKKIIHCIVWIKTHSVMEIEKENG